MFYDLLVKQSPSGAPKFSPTFVDVRDVARALIAALDSPPAAKIGRKRILISSKWGQPQEICELIDKERPAVADRLSEAVRASTMVYEHIIDFDRVKEVLGLEPTPWQKSILDSVDAVLELESEWKNRGLVPTYP